MNKKAVLLSVQPKWCALIANGKKTVEVRKTIPKIETPFKCYIYQSKSKDRLMYVMKDGDENYGVIYHGKPVFIKTYSEHSNPCEQKVIGEFICDTIISHCEMANADIAEQRGCIRREQLFEYANGAELYGWHISELKIYDKPRKLSEFNIVDNAAVLSCIHREIIGQPEYKTAHNGWIKGGYICHAGSEPDWCTKCRTKPLERPPQSWCYVEASRNE